MTNNEQHTPTHLFHRHERATIGLLLVSLLLGRSFLAGNRLFDKHQPIGEVAEGLYRYCGLDLAVVCGTRKKFSLPSGGCVEAYGRPLARLYKVDWLISKDKSSFPLDKSQQDVEHYEIHSQETAVFNCSVQEQIDSAEWETATEDSRDFLDSLNEDESAVLSAMNQTIWRTWQYTNKFLIRGEDSNVDATKEDQLRMIRFFWKESLNLFGTDLAAERGTVTQDWSPNRTIDIVQGSLALTKGMLAQLDQTEPTGLFLSHHIPLMERGLEALHEEVEPLQSQKSVEDVELARDYLPKVFGNCLLPSYPGGGFITEICPRAMHDGARAVKDRELAADNFWSMFLLGDIMGYLKWTLYWLILLKVAEIGWLNYRAQSKEEFRALLTPKEEQRKEELRLFYEIAGGFLFILSLAFLLLCVSHVPAEVEYMDTVIAYVSWLSFAVAVAGLKEEDLFMPRFKVCKKKN